MSTTLAVPGTYPTITDALEVAPDGAVISIGPGTYAERIALNGRRITLAASGEPGSATVDATGLDGPAVACVAGDVTVEGLALTGGDYPALTATGGRLTVRKCELATGYGAGLMARHQGDRVTERSSPIPAITGWSSPTPAERSSPARSRTSPTTASSSGWAPTRRSAAPR